MNGWTALQHHHKLLHFLSLTLNRRGLRFLNLIVHLEFLLCFR